MALNVAVGARRAGLSLSETADLLGFTPKTISGFTENGPKERKYPVKMPRWCERSEEKGLVPDDRKSRNRNSNKHSFQPRNNL